MRSGDDGLLSSSREEGVRGGDDGLDGSSREEVGRGTWGWWSVMAALKGGGMLRRGGEGRGRRTPLNKP